MVAAKLHHIGHFLHKRLSERPNKTPWRILINPWTVCVFLALFYVGIPIWFYLCPWLRRGAVFLHFADWPFQNLSSPESYGLNNTRHFFVETAPGVLLGVWHILPSSSQSRSSSFSEDDRPIVLYLHGSAESRSAAYRRSMYRVLNSKPLDAHVITFDYRGFGDSSYTSPTVRSLEEDAVSIYKWLNRQVPASRIILWGHSLGSGVAVRLAASLASSNESNPFAVVLEAPFTSIAEATRTFPLSFFHRRLPLFKNFCSDRTRHPDTHFDSESLIGSVTAPLLVLHAADDSMVWSEQGKRLWKRALQSRHPYLHEPRFVELSSNYGCGHRNIHKAPNLPEKVDSFLQSISAHSENQRNSN
ncbi:lysophosphatidylserine lipase ABHD12-like [Uloborus diversus]|uniref:lysophosphatidylserine lipase ABHD12-like n=1 Tax=Uloborus diversus TaxID=327109 RepID=UPI002409194E|nr:lysophosphatidylserine lipase ABHD12-like [Uloborus diversus]